MNKKKKTSINNQLENFNRKYISYFDKVQIGPLEEEIMQEFYFDTERFKEYLKNKELSHLLDKKFKE